MSVTFVDLVGVKHLRNIYVKAFEQAGSGVLLSLANPVLDV